MCLDEMFRDVLPMPPDGKNDPDASVHYADAWKYWDGTGQNRSPNDGRSDILSDLSPGAVQSNG
jgi:hypothetical protein